MSNIIYFMLRGGSWFDFGRFAASGNRLGNRPVIRNDDIGFRIIRKHHAQP